MSILNEYINKKLSVPGMEDELNRLITEYNKLRGGYLVVFNSAMWKPIPDVSLNQDDYYVLHDLLSHKKGANKLDFYIETPGGSGEVAEEIVTFLHDNFETVSFVISGEAKSAGTIIVMSGDEILMTETGSLGPIDAQVVIGRTRVSARDYIDWLEEVRINAQHTRTVNPVDATIIAQITPGELNMVNHALKFAEGLVAEWLEKYKFKNWTETESRKIPVTPEMKRNRASEIAEKLTDREMWRSHARSLKIKDLDDIGLRVIDIDKDQCLAGIVYRIQTICKLIFTSSHNYKIFATQDHKIFRQAIPVSESQKSFPDTEPEVVEISQKCGNCGKSYSIYAKLIADKKIDRDFKKKGLVPFPKNNKINCICGFEIDLVGIRNDIESKIGRSILTE